MIPYSPIKLLEFRFKAISRHDLGVVGVAITVGGAKSSRRCDGPTLFLHWKITDAANFWPTALRFVSSELSQT